MIQLIYITISLKNSPMIIFIRIANKKLPLLLFSSIKPFRNSFNNVFFQ